MIANSSEIALKRAGVGTDAVAARESDAAGLKRLVESERIRLVYGQANVGLVASTLVALVLVLATRDVVHPSTVVAWCVALGLVTLARWRVSAAYARSAGVGGDAAVWRRRWVGVMFVSGCTWGFAGASFPDPGAPALTALVALALGGLAGAAVATQGGIYPAFAAFAVPALVPLVGWLFWQGEALYVSMGIVVAAYGAAVLGSARYYADYVERCLTYGLANMELVQELADSNEIARDANRALEAEIAERSQAEEALRRSEEHFRNLIDGSMQGIAIVRDWRVRFANDTYARMFGHGSAEQVVGADIVEDFTPPDARAALYELIRTRYQGHRAPITFESRAVRADGQEIHIEFTLHQVNWYGQRATQVTVADITERKRVEKALRANEERFKDFAESAADWFFETDEALNYTYVSERFHQISGWLPREIIGLTQRELLRDSVEDPEKLERHFQALAQHLPYQVDLLCTGKDGSLHVFHYAAKPVFGEDGAFLGYRGVGRDVTQAYHLSKQLSYQATHDALTGLLNRRAFEQRLERVLSTAREDGSTHALCYLDLDQFKVINDTCGHMAGDELLRQLGRLLPGYIRKRDTLARLGGDEFAVLMEHCSLAQAERVARTLCRAIEDYHYVWEDRSFRIGCSIGLVPISEASSSAALVMSSADTACYAAKDRGRRRVHVYHPADEELAKRHGEMQWAVRINRALEEDRFRLMYQTIAPVNVPAAKRQLNLLGDDPPPAEEGLHFELLIRLEEYDGTLSPPGAFLPAAERYNLSAQLDRWVCDTAFDWLSEHAELMARVNLCAINLSGHSLGDAGLLEHLARRFDRGDLPPGRICFEITETAAIANLAAATRFIQTLAERGCLFALDDFGSGLSSFAYLKTLPVQFLKIDGVFVKDVADDPIDLAMVKSINEIGQVMGKQTVAEFVESEEILAALKEIGVNYAQGYAIARPRPIEELLTAVRIPV